ncbi:GBS Bsp-like repeat-containing protein [Streptococcus sp. X13SY08]|uniref:GBS Bsp-like repeat-containing protein n=1 Tax=Streptococcus sp. X13SY08 TaxID=1676616 RepID=UPI00066FECF9|nr:GBS Bsp-like repeat-containing protein [Streptococcus sp. X13SY08]
MKTFKSLIYAGSLLGLFTLGQAVYADQVIAQPEVVTAQKDTTISAEVQAVFENDQLIITVTKLPFALQEVKGQLRMSDMDQKISDLVFGMQEDGSYQAKVESAVLPVESSKLMIQLDLVKNEDSLYALGGYEVDWQVNPKQGAPMGSSSSSLSSEQSSSSTSTDSQTSSSSEAGIEKEKTLMSEPTSESALQPSLSIENLQYQLGTFTVKVRNVPTSGVKEVRVPIWTEENRQDDLTWYTAIKQNDGTYQVQVDKKNHKNGIGTYQVHLYFVDNSGKVNGVTSTKASLNVNATGTIQIQQLDAARGTFTVRITDVRGNADAEVTSVQVPIWSDIDGQDDIKWYTATRQIDGSYQVNVNKAQHKNSMGVYHVHLYYVYKDGQKQGIAATKTTLESKPKGTITVENVNTKLGTFQVRVSNIVAPTGLKTVKIPVWTSANGQDDLKWYLATKQADGSYLLTVDKTNHKNELGEYQIHLYYEDASNRLLGVGSTKTTLTSPAATGNIAIENVDSKQGLFEVRVTNLSHPKGISSVQIPVWSDENGQDDIKWYAAGKQADGSYKVTVSLGNHKYSSGLYHAHLYVTHPSGEMSGVASTSAAINMLSVQPQGSLEITNRNLQTGSFDIIARILAPTAIKQVEVAVWGEVNGQNDLIWYTAVKQVDGTFKASVSQTNHKGEKGIYQVHLYMTPEVGNKTGLTTKTTVVDYKQALKRVIFLDPGHGGTDSGAYYGGVKEKDLAMGVANLLKAKLEAAGFTVLLSRTGDYYVDYVTARSQMANETNADLFISLHFNSSGVANSTAKGIETYWYESSDLYPPAINQALHNNPDRLAKSLTLANAVHGGMVSQTGASDRGVRRATFAVLRETEKPVVLVEMGFMDNESELTQIKQASYQNKLAIGLYQGIESFYATYQ